MKTDGFKDKIKPGFEQGHEKYPGMNPATESGQTAIQHQPEEKQGGSGKAEKNQRKRGKCLQGDLGGHKRKSPENDHGNHGGIGQSMGDGFQNVCLPG